MGEHFLPDDLVEVGDDASRPSLDEKMEPPDFLMCSRFEQALGEVFDSTLLGLYGRDVDFWKNDALIALKIERISGKIESADLPDPDGGKIVFGPGEPPKSLFE